jgi:hypothetical protein
MPKHLPGKVARLIGDFRTIQAIVDLTEHEMEKRIVARHAMVKLDALLKLLPQLKNEIRTNEHGGKASAVISLNDLIKRLSKDYCGSDMEAARDAMSAHALQLDLKRIVETWKSMNATVFAVLDDDLTEIDAELGKLSGAHVPAGTGHVEVAWQDDWRAILGDPAKPRYATLYPGLGTAGIVAPIPGKPPVQDNLIRAIGLLTFLRQVALMGSVTPKGSAAQQLFSEILLNDYFALLEILFEGPVRNDYGNSDPCVLDYWVAEHWAGANCLSILKGQPHADANEWRTDIRNKICAHVDPDIEIWTMDVERWPMGWDDICQEIRRASEAFLVCGRLDIRSKYLMMPPTQVKGALGLSAQEGKLWSEG